MNAINPASVTPSLLSHSSLFTKDFSAVMLFFMNVQKALLYVQHFLGLVCLSEAVAPNYFLHLE